MPDTDEKRISRKDFIKFIGAGAIVFAVGGLGGFLSTRKNQDPSNNGLELSHPGQQLREAYAQTSGGSWSLGGNTQATAIHVAMLYNGKILCVAGSGYYNPSKEGPFEAGIFDPVTNNYAPLPNQSADMFCCGHAMLANGNILIAGGTLTYDDVAANGLWLGLKKAWIYDISTGSFRVVQAMKHGRWYPTLVTLADGKVLTVNGYDEYGSYNRLIEVFDPATETWSIKYDPLSTFNYCAGEGQDPDIMPGAGTQCYGPGVGPNALLYPRMHLMPEGLVIVCGQSKTLRTFDPATGVWKFAGNMLFNASRGYGSSVLLPMQNVASEKGEVLIFGGTATSDATATNTAEILTLNGTSIASRWTNSSKKGRKHPIPVILPNGKIMVIGGTEFQNDNSLRIMEAELFDPITEDWTVLPAMTVPRLYHSSALLLPDGRVWTAGTTYSRTSRELRTEYYSPDYYSAARPAISGQPVAGNYGGSIIISTADAQNIGAVSLVRLGTETHAYNCDQRLVWLQITSTTATSITVQAPVNPNIAPPGYYMIHVLKQGIPSVARIIKIPGGSLPSDITPPDISISSPSEGSTVSGPSTGVPITVTGAASDDLSGVQKVEVKVGNTGSFQLATPSAPGNWSTWSYSGTSTSDGPQSVVARATDNAGNTRDATVNVNVVFNSGFVKIYSVIPTASYGDLSTGTAIRIGEVVTSSSALIGENIKRVSVILKKSGNPTGTVSVVVRKGSDNSIALTFGTVNISSLTTSDQTLTLTAPSAHVFQANDKVLVEWGGTGSSTDKVLVKRKGDSDGFGGTSAYFVSYLSSYVSGTTRDLAGDWYKESGGGPPPDTTDPSISITSPSDGSTITGPSTGVPITVTGTASDDQSGIQKVEVKFGTSSTWSLATPGSPGNWASWNITLTATSSGLKTIQARATDNAGNIHEDSVDINVAFSSSYISIYSAPTSGNYSDLSTNNATRIGEQITSKSSLLSQNVKRVSVILKKAGNPTGTVSVVVRRGSNDSIALTFGTVNISSLTTSDQTFTLTAPSAHVFQANDKVLVEWDGTGSSTDKVLVSRTQNNAFDGPNTCHVSYAFVAPLLYSYLTANKRDLSGNWYKLG